MLLTLFSCCNLFWSLLEDFGFTQWRSLSDGGRESVGRNPGLWSQYPSMRARVWIRVFVQATDSGLLHDAMGNGASLATYTHI